MTLNIICPESKKHRLALSKALDYIGITEYQILDPAHDTIAKSFTLILYVGELPKERLIKLKEISQQAWNLSAPDPAGTKEAKSAWLKSLESIKDYMLDKKDADHFKRADALPPKQLQDYLNSKTGQAIEVVLPDRRKVGIYPDNERLRRTWDLEFHASTIVNITKLFSLFDASEIIIKEL